MRLTNNLFLLIPILVGLESELLGLSKFFLAYLRSINSWLVRCSTTVPLYTVYFVQYIFY